MKLIPLSKGVSAQVDDADFDLLSAHRWYALGSKVLYAARKVGPRSSRELVVMHRLIAGAAAGQLVDHADGNTLNNQRANLRLATRSQNNTNRRREPTASNPFRGVYAEKGRWRAVIGWQGKVYHLGRHGTAEDAARAYDQKARELHAEFAVFNFPLNGVGPTPLQLGANGPDHFRPV